MYDMVMQVKIKLIIVICLIFASTTLQSTRAEDLQIPTWIKTNAKWWSEGTISDSDFISGIQYLIQKGIMKIPSTTATAAKSNDVPTWIKNNAGWWADGMITDNDFVTGIQYLISVGIINVSSAGSQTEVNDTDMSKCDQFTTAAEKRTCQKEVELENKIKNSTPYVVGPVTFYYVDNKIEHTSQGGTILTIHFVVENTGSSENVLMSCARQNSCNYALSDGQKEIQYTTHTLGYGQLTLLPNEPKLLEWSFFEELDYDPAKDYSFKIKEPWGSGSIPLGID